MVLSVNSKKGVSAIIGYVLLIVFAIIIGTIVFRWMDTYVPREAIECPDGVSLYIKQAAYDVDNSRLTVIIKNNGRFSVAGYFIHAKNSSDQTLPNIDLSQYLQEGGEIMKYGSSVIISLREGNALAPGEEVINVFNIPAEMGNISSLRVIPTLFEEQDNRNRFESCSKAKVQQKVGETEECIPNCVNPVNCGDDGCGGSCGTCAGTYVCNGDRVCIPPNLCQDTCTSLNYSCGTQTVCGAGTNCGSCDTTSACVQGVCVPNCGNGQLDSGEGCDDGDTASGDGCSGTCQIESGFSCSGIPSVCVGLCGNGQINAGEACDDGDTTSGDGCSNVCAVESGYSCVGQPSVCTLIGGSFNSCGDYCDSFPGYNNVNSCVQNPSQCAGAGKVYIGYVPGANATLGDDFCNIGNADTCCCTPG